MIIHDVEQGSPEWLKLRLGIPTASEFHKIITPGGKASKQADAYANKLVAEFMAGEPVEAFETPWMVRGRELEADAVSFYELHKGIETKKVGFCVNNGCGASPDRLIGEDGLLEVKCPAPSTHVEYLINQKLDEDYWPQIQGQIFVTGRDWADILSYHPKLPPVIIRVERDVDFINNLAGFLQDFLISVGEKKITLKERGYL